MKIIFIFLFILLNVVFASNNKNILILNSYQKGFEISDIIIKNIENKFFEHKNINIDILYMDSKQINSTQYIKRLSSLYQVQLKNRKYDLIITIDRFAYKFTIKNYSKIFTDEKILFTGVEHFSKELARVYNLEDKIYGIIQKLQIQNNINLILQTMPNIKKLYILNDRSQNGNDTSIFIIKAIKNLKSKIDIEYLRDDSLEEFKEYFKKFKKNEAILFVRYFNDTNGGFYQTNEILQAINEFKLPIFVTDNLFLNKGVLGGNVISIEDLGIITAKKALSILNSHVVNNKITINSNYKYIFDNNVLKKYNIKLNFPNKNIEIINKQKSFFEKYRNLINSVFLVSPLLILIITILILTLYSKQKTQRKLKRRIQFDEILLNSIDNPIFWRDENNKVLDANKKFCDLINIPYKQIHKHTLEEFKNNNKKISRVISKLEEYNKDKNEAQFSILHNKKVEIFYIQETSYYDSNTNENAKVTILTNITKEKELANQRLKQTQYMVQQSKLAEIGEIFSSIAHQWKSPLVAITALAQDLFYSQDNSGKEEDSYHINNIMLQVQYMNKTINDFQEFIIPSKEKTTFSLDKTIDSLLNIVKHNLKYNYINVDIIIKPNTNLVIYGYENELMQAILNIINNAKDALLINENNNRNIKIILKNEKNNLILDIIDNGPGISEDVQKKIFLQYFSTKSEGHGIGLYMSKLIIEDKLNGSISYKFTNEGSSFRIKFNQKKDNNYENINS